MKHHLFRLLFLVCFASLFILVIFNRQSPKVFAAEVNTENVTPQQNFINSKKALVVKIAKKYNLYPSLMLAQAALESNFGQSKLSIKANNYFGIKGNYNGQYVSIKTTEYKNGVPYQKVAQFKKYPSPTASFKNYAVLLRNGLIENSVFYSGTWKENASSVQDAANSLVGKYATDPSYATKIINIINYYGLDSLDKGVIAESNDVANDTNQSSVNINSNNDYSSQGFSSNEVKGKTLSKIKPSHK